ncbi:hypothetical protein AHiyo8_07060 [Arthrobacter sp. Hiyo8]|nr:hypothetical protein AHiyo8_07060 [Arthrobacter sp. Hiyo8]GAP59656.1 hypothetical protein AHiyo1_30000 [Arthrobacter sp. Hiyo1]
MEEPHFGSGDRWFRFLDELARKDYLGCPTFDRPQMPEEIPQCPARARRDRTGQNVLGLASEDAQAVKAVGQLSKKAIRRHMPSIMGRPVSLNSSGFQHGVAITPTMLLARVISHWHPALRKQAYYGGCMPDLNDWTTPRLLSTAARLVEHAWNEKLAVLGLTHAGVIALEVLDAEGAMVQARLSTKVQVRAQTMGQTLSRLEAHGHITRERSRLDGRSQRVAVSESGRTALVQARALDRNLTPGVEVGVEELRGKLVAVIRWLGSARWGEEMPENESTATSKDLPEQS